MIFSLETGYFIWNVSAWTLIFLFSAFVFCLVTYVIKSNVTCSWVREGKTLIKDGTELNEKFENAVCIFRKKCLTPWLEQPFVHLLAVAILFFIFIIALFSRMGGE